MKNLQYLATEIFKVKNGLSPIIMNQVFNFQENERYNLCYMHTNAYSFFFLKNGKKCFKIKLRKLRFFTQLDL